MTFAEKLILLRKAKGLTAKELAEKSGVSSVSISSYENGIRKPNVLNTQKLAEALGCDFDELYETI